MIVHPFYKKKFNISAYYSAYAQYIYSMAIVANNKHTCVIVLITINQRSSGRLRTMERDVELQLLALVVST